MPTSKIIMIAVVVVFVILSIISFFGSKRSKKKVNKSLQEKLDRLPRRDDNNPPSNIPDDPRGYTPTQPDYNYYSKNEGVELTLKNVNTGELRKINFTGSVVIGSSEMADVTIYNDRFISRQHCRLSYNNGRFYIEDLNSSNGTIINRNMISGACYINAEDELKIGETIFVIII